MMKNIAFKLNMVIILLVVLFASVSFADEAIVIDFSGPEYVDENGSLKYGGDGISFRIKKDDDGFSYRNGVVEDTYHKIDGTVETVNIGTQLYYKVPLFYQGPDALIILTRGSTAYGLADASGVMDDRGRDMYYDIQGKYYLLSNNNTYYILFTDYDLQQGNGEVFAGFGFMGVDEIHQIVEEDDSWFEKIERIMSDFVKSIADVVNWLIGKVVGRQITLDDIIFNKFPEIRIDFFNTDIFGNQVESESELIAGNKELGTIGLKEPVTTMYQFFRSIALIGYMIVLVYVGLKIMLSSTTAKKKATYKETFLYWVTGIVILFFMPYYMKYIIALDEGIVTYISDDSGMRSQKSREGAENATQFNSEYNNGFLKTDFESVIDYSGKDYMSAIGKLANEKHKLGYSIAYLVLTWQIITMLVYYYKRIFIIALLIMIFPLIALTFVWDKLNDGRSQALSAWTREFTITVFVQVFHAIVYVFVTNAIYSTLQTNNADFILLIIASSFMFEGEDILKKMFGGGGEALGSATQSAKNIAFIAGGAVGVGSKIIKNTVGKNGIVRSTVRSFNEARTYGFLTRTPSSMPQGTSTQSRMELIANDQIYHHEVGTYLPTEGQITPIINEAAEMLHGLNNSNSPEEFSNALNQYRQLMNARNGVGVRHMTEEEIRQFDEMMRRSGINIAQLTRLDKAMENAAIATAAVGGNIFDESNRNRMNRITQNLRIEIEAIFPAVDAQGNRLTGKENVMADKIMNAVLINMRDNGVGSRRAVRNYEQEWNSKWEEVREMANNIGYKTYFSNDIRGTIQRRKNIAENIMNQYRTINPGMTAIDEQRVSNMALQVASVRQMFDGDASAYQLAEAFQAIDSDDSSREMAKTMLEIAEVDADIDQLKFLITKHIDSPSERNNRSSLGMENKTLFNTRDNAGINLYFATRGEEIYHEFLEEAGTLSADEDREVKEFAVHLAKVEHYDMGLADSSTIKESMSFLGNHEDLADRMMQTIGMEKNYATLKDETDHLIDVTDWASSTVNQMEAQASSRADDNPYFTILDIIEAGKNGRISTEPEKFVSTEDMLNRAARGGTHDEILNRKITLFNHAERERTETLNEAASEFGTYALEAEGYNDTPAYTPRREITMDGLTNDDAKSLAFNSTLSGISGTAQLVTDILVTPITTMAGFAIGTATTDDFMPVEEAMMGAIAGNRMGQNPGNTVGTLTAEKQRQEKISELKKKVDARAKDYDRERLNARQAYEDAAYAARDGRDGSLTFTGANATMHLEVDGSLSATVNVMAENAAYLSVSETAGMPSRWEAYQENVYYRFRDNNPSAPHTLFIYVRDASGNTLAKKISGISL